MKHAMFLGRATNCYCYFYEKTNRPAESKNATANFTGDAIIYFIKVLKRCRLLLHH
jgi:hypothetical protein